MSGSSSRGTNRGFVLPTAAVLFIVIIPVVGLAVDLGMMYMVQSKLQSATDAAALAAARSLARGTNSTLQQTNAQNTALAYINANFPVGYLGTASLNTPLPTVDISNVNYRTVTVNASVQVPHLFLRWFGGANTTVNALAMATRRDVNVMIVMDRSGSLQMSGSCTPLKAAAVAFTDKFSEGRDRVGLITFATSSREDFPLATNFKTAPTPVATIINSVTCNGWTNSAQGLWTGYQALAAVNEPASLNVILFFTDGDPTAFTGTFPIKSTSPCNDPAAKTGTMAGGGGIYSHVAPPQPLASDNAIVGGSYGNPAGCAFAANFDSSAGAVSNDVSYIPVLDFWGNNLNSGYLPVNLGGGGISINSSYQELLNASINGADDAARRIRTVQVPGNGSPALPGVTIFSIGLGGSGAPSADFLRRVANDPASSSYDSAAPTGLYLYAPTASDLGNAFRIVASEILRLAK
jgi:Flp pilus assembly protein TadG